MTGYLQHVGGEIAKQSILAPKIEQFILDGEESLVLFLGDLPADVRAVVRTVIEDLKKQNVATVVPQPYVLKGPERTLVWSKTLTRSDAQRKRTGNQRGSITLVQAGHTIDARTYFRRVFFDGAAWLAERTKTGELRETAAIAFNVDFLGESLGAQLLRVSYAANREASQANYTSLLHLNGLTQYFARRDVTGKTLRLVRHLDGTFELRIAEHSAA